MLRQIHRWPGLLAAALILTLALSGAALSLFPALERLSSPAAVSGQTAGAVVDGVAAAAAAALASATFLGEYGAFGSNG